ncbi:Hint domain-containing protein [uncultured Jannaschia sp.]|uniref:Hint domain-containing protein n=1 Tax=uncultured Jannaschia sp. TaxID=293347 RepID=UPI00261563CD|nr:Hint domain-containing protein [uncultured Jannaschia sp.]
MTVNMIFLGTFADVDTDESNFVTENARSLEGRYDDLTLTQVIENDRDGDGAIQDNEAQAGDSDPDFLTYDVGFGQESYELDSTSRFEALVFLTDGTSRLVEIAVLQTTIGDVFVRDVDNALDGLDFRSIELTRFIRSDFSGSRTGNSIDNTTVACFAAGTAIATPTGPVPVERLRPGDHVLTRDHGAQTLRSVFRRKLVRAGRHAPIEFAPGSLGQGRPSATLRLSPQHRVLLDSPIVSRMFGRAEVLVAAKRLVDGIAIRQADGAASVAYYHLLCAQHELILAEGCWTETLLTGDQAVAALGALAAAGDPARTIPPTPRADRLIARHRKNGRALQPPA